MIKLINLLYLRKYLRLLINLMTNLFLFLNNITSRPFARVLFFLSGGSFAIIYNLFTSDPTGLLNLSQIGLYDSPEAWQIGFQDSASLHYTSIADLHDKIFFYLIIIVIVVFWILGNIIYLSYYKKVSLVLRYWNHGTAIELLWTIIPALILFVIAQPSFLLLYILDEVIAPVVTVKVTGNQWFWTFEYSDYEKESGESISFESYMIPENDLEMGQFRLLEVDNKVKIPVDTHVRFIVTGADVINDYAVPSLGLKVDAVPGRLNQASTLAERIGVFYG